MSRSNQTDLSNPCVRWMEWNGEKGGFKFYDKDVKQNIELDFAQTFLLLDQVAAVRGWNDASNSGIYSNEVKDVTKEPFIVKSFKGGLVAQGLYKEIKDKVSANGGHFVSSIYIGFKIDGELQIANIQFKGAALNAWIDFRNKNKSDIYKKAVTVTGVQDGQKGRIVFKTPVFGLKEVSQETDNIAKSLDMDLQNYFKAYFSKTTNEQASHEKIEHQEPQQVSKMINAESILSDDDLPF